MYIYKNLIIIIAKLMGKTNKNEGTEYIGI